MHGKPEILQWHQFLPTLFKMEGFTVTEIPVRNNPRFAGQSHYGVWNRLFASFYDLLAVRWMKKRMRPYQIVEEYKQEPSAREALAPPTISVVVPCHNEQENLPPLIKAIQAALAPLQRDY